jgi:carbamate kinase
VIRQLVAAGVVVIASGGGGVPVVDDGPLLAPREGVVDKDLAAAILARDVDAPTLLILTDVDHVQRGFGTEDVEPIRRMTTSEARTLLDAGEFAAGSMGPKVEAAVRFIESGGRRAVIGDLGRAPEALDGATGTAIVGG